MARATMRRTQFGLIKRFLPPHPHRLPASPWKPPLRTSWPLMSLTFTITSEPEELDVVEDIQPSDIGAILKAMQEP